MLEERLALTAFTVTDLSDSATDTASLRYAITQANANPRTGGDTITIAATGTIELTTPLPWISDPNLTINGPGAGQLTIDGQRDVQVLAVGPGASVKISSLTIANGNVSFPTLSLSGGGISNEGSLDLTDCTLSGNVANSGGGLWNSGYATLNRCVITHNTATAGSSSAYAGGGGGIYSGLHAITKLTNCTVSDNQASGLGGGIAAVGTTLTLTDSTVSGNSASGTQANPAGIGGGIAVVVGMQSVFSAPIPSAATLLNSTVTGNSAGISGGGIAVRGQASLTLQQSLLSTNSAVNDGGGVSSRLSSALFQPSLPTVTVLNSTLYGNTAAVAGAIENGYGSTLTLTDSTLTDNRSAAGAALAASGLNQLPRDTLLQDTLIAGNLVDGATGTSSGDVSGIIDSKSANNLIGDGDLLTGIANGSQGNLIGSARGESVINPRLGLLGNYGGPTETVPLLLGSPALGAGVPLSGAMTDQRGTFRNPTAPAIGAFEPAPATHVSISSPAIIGAGIAITATVSALDAQGNVDPDYTGSVSLSSSDSAASLPPASYQMTSKPGGDNGTHSFTVTLNTLGSQIINATTSDDLTVGAAHVTVVTPVATTTTLTAAAVPPLVGQFATFTATVTTAVEGARAPTGSVSFKDGGSTLGTVPLAMVNGVPTATFSTSALDLGTHAITAVYGGDTLLLGSTSNAVSEFMEEPTTTTLSASVKQAVFGQPVTIRATVAPFQTDTGTPTGTVEFFGDGKSLGTETLNNGVATLVTTALTVGDHLVTAVYAGDATFFTSTSHDFDQITTVAGVSNPGFAGNGGSATQVPVVAPGAVAADSEGDVYIALPNDNVVRKVTPGGTITTVAGNGLYGSTGDGGPATSAAIGAVSSIAVDSKGDLFLVAGIFGNVREVKADGTITTVAGDGSFGDTGDGGQATSAAVICAGLAVDGAGDLFIADSWDHVVREVLPNGIIMKYAGTGQSGNTGDGGPATKAELNSPAALAVDAKGDLFIADSWSDVVREVTLDGTIKTVAGNGSFGESGDGGPAKSAAITPSAIAVDANGNLFIDDQFGNVIREVVPSGTISTVAGTGKLGKGGDGGAAIGAQLNNPAAVTVDGAGNLFIADRGNNVVREVSTAGTISTFAGIYLGDGGPANRAALNGPQAIAFDTNGDLIIADTNDSVIREVMPDGVVATIAGTGIGGLSGDGGPATSAQLSNPSGLAVDAMGDILIADSGNGVIREVTPQGTISTIVSRGAGLNDPTGVAFDSHGDLFISDSGNNQVRELTPSGTLITVAGNGKAGYSGDGGLAVNAELDGPSGLAVDGHGDLFIADRVNGVIREVTPNGMITTVAGTQASSPYATNAVAVDAEGNLYVGQSGSTHVLILTPNGTVISVLGNGADNSTGDGGSPSAASIIADAIAFDAHGNLFIAGQSAVRELPVGLLLSLSSAPTSASLTTSSASVFVGQAVTLTATIAAPSPSTATPDGTVTFLDGATVLGTGVLDANGVAAVTTSALAVGSHAITAEYGGDTGPAHTNMLIR